jgi:hypothetical protein
MISEKKNKGEPIQVIIHIYMEMSQGNSLCSCHKQAKNGFLFLIYNWRTGGQNRSCLEGLVPMGGGRRWGEGVGDEYGANTVYIFV